MKTFGQLIKEGREGRYSVRGLAKEIGISPSYLNGLENNRDGKVPSAEVVKKIASKLNLNIDHLKERCWYIKPSNQNHAQTFARVVSEEDARWLKQLYILRAATKWSFKRMYEEVWASFVLKNTNFRKGDCFKEGLKAVTDHLAGRDLKKAVWRPESKDLEKL